MSKKGGGVIFLHNKKHNECSSHVYIHPKVVEKKGKPKQSKGELRKQTQKKKRRRIKTPMNSRS